MNKTVKYGLIAVATVVVVGMLVKGVVTGALVIGGVAVVAYGAHWAFNKFKEQKKVEYKTSVGQVPSGARTKTITETDKHEMEFMFANKQHKEEV